MVATPEGYIVWEREVGSGIRRDPLWRVQAYRLASFAAHCCWDDSRAVHRLPMGRAIADQLWRSTNSVPAGIAEGYSRSSLPDRLRFMEYALGSAREAIVWYRAAQQMLPGRRFSPGADVLESVRNLLLTSIASQRRLHPRRPVFGTAS